MKRGNEQITRGELRSDERELLYYYNRLNDIGKAKARVNIEDITELRKYTEKYHINKRTGNIIYRLSFKA